MAIWRRVSFWVSKATRPQAHASSRASPPPHTHTHKYNPALPWQQWFCERASMLRYTYIDCLVNKYV
jgi:hypothetical protein